METNIPANVTIRPVRDRTRTRTRTRTWDERLPHPAALTSLTSGLCPICGDKSGFLKLDADYTQHLTRLHTSEEIAHALLLADATVVQLLNEAAYASVRAEDVVGRVERLAAVNTPPPSQR